MSRFSNWSHSLRRTFVKDYSIPVSVVDDPYFEHQIIVLDRQYGTWEKVKLLESSLAKYKSEDEFFKAMRDLRNKIINHIKANPDYKDLPFQKLDGGRKISERSIYKTDFVGKEMVSIDLVKANFQSFQMTVPEVIDNKDTYEDFVGQFTDDQYFISSKKIRQVVFGNLNPKRQIAIAKNMMHIIMHHVEAFSTDVVTLSSDELVFEKCNALSVNGLKQKIQSLPHNVRIKDFIIEKVPTKTSSIFIKKYKDGTFDLKCCPGNYTIEVLRHIYGEPVHPMDKVFYNDGRLCEYKDSLF